jgi:regulator of sigma E protease
VTILVFIGLLLALVLAHEWGHFFAARRAGCRVEEFAFGFPPRLWSVVRGGTRYSFNALPLGGYVKIEGEDMGQEDPPPSSFAAKSPAQRVAILAAGVIMNVVLAAVLLAVQAGIGTPVLVTEENASLVRDIKTFIVSVDAGSPAEAARLQRLDRIVRIGNISDPTVAAVQDLVSSGAGQEIEIEIERQGMHQVLSLVPRENPPPGQGALGVALQETGLSRVPWWQAPWQGVVHTGEMMAAIVSQFWLLATNLLKGETAGEAVTGPIGIAILTNEVTKLGVAYVLEFAALISLNLALINIFPFPALDGGRIGFVAAEAVLGRRVSPRFERSAHAAGFAVLIVLMLLVTFKDVSRFF